MTGYALDCLIVVKNTALLRASLEHSVPRYYSFLINLSDFS